MGCFCCKLSAIEDSKESPRVSSKTSSELRVSRETLPRREEAYQAKDRYGNGNGNDGRVMLLDKQTNGSVRQHTDSLDRSKEKMEHIATEHSTITRIPKATEGEHVAAGWPPWLAAVAGGGN